MSIRKFDPNFSPKASFDIEQEGWESISDAQLQDLNEEQFNMFGATLETKIDFMSKGVQSSVDYMANLIASSIAMTTKLNLSALAEAINAYQAKHPKKAAPKTEEIGL